jgi:hypothetical protein
MSELTLADIANWDPDALRDVFDLSHTHSLALQGVGDSVGDVHHNLTDWHGASGDAARAELGAVRHDINAYGSQMQAVAAAVNKAVADVSEVKRRYQDIVDTCTLWKLTLQPTGVIDDTNPTPDLQRMLVQRREQAAVLDMMRLAASTDDELAAAIYAAINANEFGTAFPNPTPLVRGPQAPTVLPRGPTPLPMTGGYTPRLVQLPLHGVIDGEPGVLGAEQPGEE